MTIQITVAAANLIEEGSREHIERLGKNLIPVIVWITADTNHRAPRLGVGLIEKERVPERLLECESPGRSIAHLLPDEILERHQSSRIDVVDNEFVFVEDEK